MRTLSLWLALCIVLMTGCEDSDVKTTDCPSISDSFESAPYASVDAKTKPVKYPCDYIMASKNGEAWTSLATSVYGFQNDTLYVHGSVDEETLAFKFLFTGPGTYEIATKPADRSLNGNAYYYTTVGRDVIIDMYVLAEKATVEIVEYNETERTIKGSFDFSFNELSGSSTLRFERGTFSAHLPD